MKDSMQYITVRLIFIALLIISCVAVALARFITEAVSQLSLNTDQSVVPLIFIEGKKGFVFVGAACGNGFSNFHISLDGVKLSHSGMKYTKRTERELQAILKDAVVIERGHRLDNLDQVIGERGVLVYPDKENGKQRAMIYSKSEDSICFIESASLEHVLSFEQLYIRRAIKKGNQGGAGSQ